MKKAVSPRETRLSSMATLAVAAFFSFSGAAALAASNGQTFDLLNSGEGIHAVPFGHNVSSTSYVLPSGSCTIGAQLTGCGWHGVSLGVSPWLIKDYGMNNYFLRARVHKDASSQTSVQAAYFKTFRSEPTGGKYDDNLQPIFEPGVRDYQMEAAWLQGIHSVRVNDHFVHHLNLALQYYFDDSRPYSLRRPSMHDHKAQLNVSDLLESRLAGALYLVGEVGLLDASGAVPHLHIGSSLQWREDRWMIHAGLSMNTTQDALFSAGRVDGQRRVYETYRTYDDPLSDDDRARDYGLHPEFSLQVYF